MSFPVLRSASCSACPPARCVTGSPERAGSLPPRYDSRRPPLKRRGCMPTEPGQTMANRLLPDGDAELNGLLTRWAEQQRLTTHQAETVRLAIVTSSATFDAGWWQELFGSAG